MCRFHLVEWQRKDSKLVKSKQPMYALSSQLAFSFLFTSVKAKKGEILLLLLLPSQFSVMVKSQPVMQQIFFYIPHWLMEYISYTDLPLESRRMSVLRQQNGRIKATYALSSQLAFSSLFTSVKAKKGEMLFLLLLHSCFSVMVKSQLVMQ
jgi:hypothetical protein